MKKLGLLGAVLGSFLALTAAVSSYQAQTTFVAATITTATIATANITTAAATTVNATNVNVSGILKVANGTVGAPSIALTSNAATGFYASSGTRIQFVSNGDSIGFIDGGLWHVRPTATSFNVFAVGTAATVDFQVDTLNNVFGVHTSGQRPLLAAKIGTLYFCGLGPNGSTSVYMAPTLSLPWGGASAGDATNCASGSNTTEATADKPMFPFDINPVAMQCGLQDVATDAGVTFALRNATADVGGEMTCTTGALDGSGHADCDDLHGPSNSAYTIAAGTTIAMRVTAASGNESTSNAFCVVTYGWR